MAIQVERWKEEENEYENKFIQVCRGMGYTPETDYRAKCYANGCSYTSEPLKRFVAKDPTKNAQQMKSFTHAMNVHNSKYHRK